MIKKLFTISFIALFGFSSQANVPENRCEKEMYSAVISKAIMQERLQIGSIVTIGEINGFENTQRTYNVEYFEASNNPEYPDPISHQWKVVLKDLTSCDVKSVAYSVD